MIIVRDEEWLVTRVEQTADDRLFRCQGLSQLVRDTTASFYEGLEKNLRPIEPLDPAQAVVVADDSPRYRRSRLWMESTLRKTAVPLDGTALTVSGDMLADPLRYQRAAVRQAFNPENLRTRILLADAVGLGKTLEIGMILSELVRRGRGERILVVTPRHVLEQMQHEMWSRFALPFVRLDSQGIQRVRQKLPATRNPFSYYKRVIISIDTLKSEEYIAHLRNQSWDAVVIDESHNITNSATANSALARTLAPRTDALILASATPHNGREESFAELIRLLEPTAVRPDGTIIEEEAKRLIIRRHRNSDEVAREVGSAWAERLEPQNFLVAASMEENEVAIELDEAWLHPGDGKSPYAGSATQLFPWTLAKAFLSSPAALIETTKARIDRIKKSPTKAQQDEIAALERLKKLAEKANTKESGKYQRLLAYLKEIKVGPGSENRAVIFAERVPTLEWLRRRLIEDVKAPGETGQKSGKFTPDQVVILHGGLTDVDQQKVVESFKQGSSPIRILVTGDVASEGVNLHAQCHELIHFDIPWSLIRIEQRNGRIDRYGQTKPPQITTLLLDPATEKFSGDLRVLTRLLEREREAHTALGDVASLMGDYKVEAEEAKIKQVLAGERPLDEVVREVEEVKAESTASGFLARAGAAPPPPVIRGRRGGAAQHGGLESLYPEPVAFLDDALHEAYPAPEDPPARGGIGWRDHGPQRIVELIPPPDLRQRLEVLPQSYLADRQVIAKFRLVTSKDRGKELLADALADQTSSSWPEAHYLGPLHPVIDWAADRALASLGRNQVFAVRGNVDCTTVLMLGTLTNRRGQVVSSCYLSGEFPYPNRPMECAINNEHKSAAEMVAYVGFTGASNPGPVTDLEELQPLVAEAVARASHYMNTGVFNGAKSAIEARVGNWSRRTAEWREAADANPLIPRSVLEQRRITVEREQQIAAAMSPERQLIRPLLVVLPADRPTAEGTGE